ncbi:MAG: hypothetical protein FJ319_09020 [SAR202 cluster bacterium]|nr:hypothetical protein [SAR202 cluster bacterium]
MNPAKRSFADRLRADKRHYIIVFFVFGLSGSLAALFSRIALNGILGMDGNIWSGPWSYRISYLLLVPPFYSVTLITVGTLFGKHAYFKHRVIKTSGRILPLVRLKASRSITTN